MKLLDEPRHLYFKINKPEIAVDYSGLNVSPSIYNIEDTMIEVGNQMINYFLSYSEDNDYLFETLDVDQLIESIVDGVNEVIADLMVPYVEEDSNVLDVLYLKIYNIIDSNRISIVSMIGEIRKAVDQLEFIAGNWGLFIYNVNFIKGERNEFLIHAIFADKRSSAVW